MYRLFGICRTAQAPVALADIASGVWQDLRNAVDDSMAAWRLPCLATQFGDGCRQRIVVLRGVDIDRRIRLTGSHRN